MAESSDACEPVVVRRSPEISATAKFIKSGETESEQENSCNIYHRSKLNLQVKIKILFHFANINNMNSNNEMCV